MSELGARTFPEEVYLRLKTATRRLVRKVGGLEAAEALTGRSHASFGRYQSPHHPQFMPIDQVIELESVAEEPVVTAALADLAGFLIVRKPPATVGDALSAEVGAAVKESCEAVAKIGEALATGGTITAAEIRALNLRAEIAEAMQAMSTLDDRFARILEEEGKR